MTISLGPVPLVLRRTTPPVSSYVYRFLSRKAVGKGCDGISSSLERVYWWQRQTKGRKIQRESQDGERVDMMSLNKKKNTIILSWSLPPLCHPRTKTSDAPLLHHPESSACDIQLSTLAPHSPFYFLFLYMSSSSFIASGGA